MRLLILHHLTQLLHLLNLIDSFLLGRLADSHRLKWSILILCTDQVFHHLVQWYTSLEILRRMLHDYVTVRVLLVLFYKGLVNIAYFPLP